MASIFLLLKLGLRNIVLNRRRSIFILVILTLGCSGALIVSGFFQGVLHTLREQFIHGSTGHLMVAKAGYYDHGIADPMNFLFPQNDESVAALPRQPEVKAVIPRLQFGGLVNTEEKAASVNVLGVDPKKEREMVAYGDNGDEVKTFRITAGQDLDSEAGDGILLGSGVAKTLHLKVGDSVTMLTTQSGRVNGANFRVQGIFETPIKEFDNHFVKMGLKPAQSLLGMEGGLSSLLIVLHSTDQTAAVQSRLEDGFGKSGFELLGWEQRGDFYRNGRDLLTQIDMIVRVLFFVLILLSIVSSVNMAFFERLREFGTMLALGNPRSFVSALILTETLLLGLLGATLGLGFGYLASLGLAQVDFQMPPLPGSTSGYPALLLLSPSLFLQVAGLGVLVSLAAACIVSLRVYKVRIVEALSYV